MSFGSLFQSLGILALLISFTAGTVLLTEYANKPGATSIVPSDLTQVDSAGFPRCEENENTLILFYHPHCPCTQATVQNLELLASHFGADSHCIAVAFTPSDEPENWIESSTTLKLKTHLGFQIVPDEGAKICKKFGVTTSGHLLLYGRDRKLQFSGGLTQSRGHAGRCAPSNALIKCLNGKSTRPTLWPVFGCPMTLKGDNDG